ncbi:iron-siderophore ABC transporter substrate-binding protein [Actinomadura alba]|uniref:Iron-siderophore ABC transporter substrate-binding protein n=1 Tax=Actinomadura alba TaxID=406431 RepID=A0ABR7LT18_9ACTN|nr:iron-siderophore ABC transporter substrate-binding protein [Actinomadura alba]MBC6467823.1 iron-siderophore ABC transporter substrate-binding protein [Actinomadura alba]
MSTAAPLSERVRPPILVLTLVLALSLVLAACGSGDDDAAPRAEPAKGQGAFPVRIDHKYGTTEISAQAKRVVTLGLSDQDAVLALGIKPVGAVDWFKERPYGKWAWTQGLWGASPPTIVGERDNFNIEKIAVLEPDLIIALYSGMKKEQYDALSRIAPTVGQPLKYDDYAAPWQEMTRMTGRALGMEARANELITKIDQRFAQVREEYPEFAGKTTAVVDPYEAGKYAVFAPSDPKVVFMTSLGFSVPEKVTKAVGKEYAAEIGSERLDLVDVDRLVFLTGDPTARKRVEADEVFGTLEVAKEKRALFAPYEDPPVGAALSFNTVLSVPYAIDQIIPLLTAPAS